jgi:undecaprenyl diphosphate synthase
MTKRSTKSNQALEPATSLQTLPLRHVAIIMDGNRRWADRRRLPRLVGHQAGVKSLKQLVEHVGHAGLKYLTVYAFSSENWQRSQEEVQYLFELFAKVLTDELSDICKNNVKLSFLGQIEKTPGGLSAALREAQDVTRNNKGLCLQIALNYGSRSEITEATRRIALDVVAGRLSAEAIDDSLIASYLYTSGMPDPELVIRTGGEMRLSNYLLWQSAYAELYVTDVLWPDFTAQEFDKAIVEFRRRERRYGGD